MISILINQSVNCYSSSSISGHLRLCFSVFANEAGKTFYFDKFHEMEVLFIILLSYVQERPWWPIQNTNKGRQKKARKAKRRGRSDQDY